MVKGFVIQKTGIYIVMTNLDLIFIIFSIALIFKLNIHFSYIKWAEHLIDGSATLSPKTPDSKGGSEV